MVSEAECVSPASSHGYAEVLLDSTKMMVAMQRPAGGSASGSAQIIKGGDLEMVKEAVKQD